MTNDNDTMVTVPGECGCVRRVTMEVAAHYMHDTIRESLHSEGIDDPQEFVDRYVELHRGCFGDDWIVN